MAVEQETFKFPDEQAAEREAQRKFHQQQQNEDDIQVKIEDDTPEEDRGRVPLPKEVVDELENDDLDEYSEKVKKRLGQMKKVWHDERRAKEAAEREKFELLRVAQMREEENRQLKQRLGVGEKAFVQEVTKSANTELATAKERLKQAYESGDSDRIAEAQEALTDAKLKLREVERYRPSLQDDEVNVQANQQYQAPQAPQPVVDAKAEAWRKRNTWFGANKGMTAFALGLHEELVESGLDPRSDEYYQRVDQTMRRRFSDYFEDAVDQTTETNPERERSTQRQEERQTRNKPANVVAPVTRGTAPRQVRLTPTQVAIAKKLGLSNEQYAKELMKLENDNG